MGESPIRVKVKALKLNDMDGRNEIHEAHRQVICLANPGSYQAVMKMNAQVASKVIKSGRPS